MDGVKGNLGDVPNFAERVRAARLALGRELPLGKGSKLFGRSRSAVEYYETGVNEPAASYLEAMCEAGVSADYLLRGAGPVLRRTVDRAPEGFAAVKAVVEAFEQWEEIPVVELRPMHFEVVEDAD